MLTRRTVETVSSFYAVMAAESSLVLLTGSSVTSEVIPESSPSIDRSLSQVRLRFPFKSLQIEMESIFLLGSTSDISKSGVVDEAEIDFNFVCPSLLFSRADEETVRLLWILRWSEMSITKRRSRDSNLRQVRGRSREHRRGVWPRLRIQDPSRSIASEIASTRIAVVFKWRSISEIAVLRYAFTAELTLSGVWKISTISVLSTSHGSS